MNTMDFIEESSEKGSMLLLEPFYGGSHKQLVDLLNAEISGCVVVTLPAKKWHWRARTSALYFCQNIPVSKNYKTLFSSSVLNLCELVALRPDLARLHKVLYFHENQLQYPVRKQQDRDFQYGYNQILSSMVADVVLFNSEYNMTSFLSSIQSFLKLIPDHRPKNIDQEIRPKCKVIHFPIMFPPHGEIAIDITNTNTEDKSHPPTNTSDAMMLESGDKSPQDSKNQVETTVIAQKKPKTEDSAAKSVPILENSLLHIVWPHRWEHDKGPEDFFQALFQLKELGLQFYLSVLGETYTDVPAIFSEAKEKLQTHIKHWGYQESKDAYYNVLREADVVVSTANHEFFGVAMLEAVHLGCFPLCPNRLVYPEIFPKENLYNTKAQLVKRLKQFCERPDLVRKKVMCVETSKYSWATLAPKFKEILMEDIN